ncbi:amino acid permease family protein [Scenedesmus sp. NREL 46B-D3]|nr:amino acid permease family protein [Scenedesmus sp. NREL 46B-D3]
MVAPPSRRYDWSGFACTKDYLQSLARTPKLLSRAGYVRHPETQMADKAASGTELTKCLNWFHVMMLGTGMIVGAGVFVSTGVAAQEQAGPAIVISFIVAGISALLSSLCYSEFATQYPLAGGAYNYISLTMGELAAWLIVTTLVLEYVLANAAVARSFSAYFAALIGKEPGFFTFAYLDYTVDFMAAGVIVLCCLLLSFSTAGGSWFNIVVTGSQLLVILIILIAGFVKANPANLSPFLPYGVKGIFNGASFVFFSFIGFDCVSTLAEEVKNPAVDMPVGIVGCITFVGIIYTLMSLCLVMMVPYDQLDPAASFATAFTQVGLPWGQYLVALGATLGIITGVLVGVMGVARIVTSMGRTHLFFPVFGRVSKRFGTPIWATLFVTVAALPLCILTDLPDLIDMVSAGTLLVFGVVALALIWKRTVRPKHPFADNAKPFVLMAVLTGCCIAFACIYALCEGVAFIAGMAVTAGLAILCCIAIHVLCPQYDRPSYRAPFFPYLPGASLLLNSFLMASLPANAYWQLAIFFAVVLVFYVLYSIHAAQNFEETCLAGQKAVDLEDGPAVRGPSLEDLAQPSPSDVAMHSLGPLGGDPAGLRLGRTSGGVTRLPPPTL